MRWQDIQKEIAVCEECVGRWGGHVTRPLQIGEIPDPPPIVKVLFVGVAPTDEAGKNRGNHFYSHVGDNLRNGLFRLLEERFRIPLDGLGLIEGTSVFHRQGYFFVHAGKMRPVGQDAPLRDALVYCARRHLRVEINILNPLVVCFLGLKNLAPVTRSLFGRQIGEVPLRATIDGWTGWVAVAPQPVRGWEERTAQVLQRVLSLVELGGN